MKALALAAALLAPTIAAATSVGGYALGMSNAEAAKVGLTNCRRQTDYIICEGSFASAPKVFSSMLAFDEKSKRLEQIKVFGNYTSSQIDDVFRDLKVSACPQKLDGTSPMLKAAWRACHYPIGTLNVKSQLDAKPGKATHYFAVEWLYEPGADKRFFAEEQDRKRRANALKNFQSGK